MLTKRVVCSGDDLRCLYVTGLRLGRGRVRRKERERENGRKKERGGEMGKNCGSAFAMSLRVRFPVLSQRFVRIEDDLRPLFLTRLQPGCYS